MIKPFWVQPQIGLNCAVKPLLAAILQEHLHIGGDFDGSDSIQGHNIKLPHGFVIFRRVARRHNDPPLWKGVGAEGFVLQKLQHSRRQGVRHAVDFVQEQNPLPAVGPLHGVIHRCDDLTHGIPGHRNRFRPVGLLVELGQADGALAGVVGHGVGNQTDVQLLGNLFHDGGFSDAGRAHQQDWPLADGGKQIIPPFILTQIGT